MPTIREQFHAIGNSHNKITMISGCVMELIKIKPLATLTPEELKAKQEEMISGLKTIESSAIDADRQVTELKNYIYKNTTPETQI